MVNKYDGLIKEELLDEIPDFIQMVIDAEEEDLKSKLQSEFPEQSAEDSLRSEASFQDDQDPSHQAL